MITVGCFDYTGETIFNADDFGNGFRLRAEKDIFTRVQLQLGNLDSTRRRDWREQTPRRGHG